MRKAILAGGILMLASAFTGRASQRARDLGIRVGVLTPGKWNAVTDVEGVRVGQVTLTQGQEIRTGVTVILPHPDNIFLQKVPAAVYVANGFGKLMGSTQIEELGTLETPIALTGTLNVPRVADALLDYMLSLPGMEEVRSINPVVGETNDGTLSDIRRRPVGRKDLLEALHNAAGGPVQEGSVGAGTGTICYGFKGGIGTASRILPESLGGFTVGVLVQTNFGGVLQIGGAPVGQELGRYYLKSQADESSGADGSCMIIVATDAPLDSRNLRRLAKRAMLGLAATGGTSTSGSGDYVIAFSTAPALRVPHQPGASTVRQRMLTVRILMNEDVSPLFQAVREATEEAIYNSLFMARTTSGRGGVTIEALPVEKVIPILRKYGVIPPGGRQQ